MPGAGDGEGRDPGLPTALRCAVNQELKEEWQEYLEQTENHERARGGGPDGAGPLRGAQREKARTYIQGRTSAERMRDAETFAPAS